MLTCTQILIFLFPQVEGRDIPIVHRVLKLHEKEDGSVKFLTKGDNNSVDDRGLYAPGQGWDRTISGQSKDYLIHQRPIISSWLE